MASSSCNLRVVVSNENNGPYQVIKDTFATLLFKIGPSLYDQFKLEGMKSMVAELFPKAKLNLDEIEYGEDCDRGPEILFYLRKKKCLQFYNLTFFEAVWEKLPQKCITELDNYQNNVLVPYLKERARYLRAIHTVFLHLSVGKSCDMLDLDILDVHDIMKRMAGLIGITPQHLVFSTKVGLQESTEIPTAYCYIVGCGCEGLHVLKVPRPLSTIIMCELEGMTGQCQEYIKTVSMMLLTDGSDLLPDSMKPFQECPEPKIEPKDETDGGCDPNLPIQCSDVHPNSGPASSGDRSCGDNDHSMEFEDTEKPAEDYDGSGILLQSGDIETNPGPGYEAKFVHPLLKRHECPICLYAMKNPVQTECGHLFCRDCLEPVLRRRRPICPLDKEEITQEGIFPDNACRREILNLEVYCNYVAGGCTWMGHLKDLEAHLESCKHREIQCIQCGQYIQAASLKTHQDVECPMRPERCVHCNHEVPSQQMKDHLKKVCPDVLHSCPNGCNPTLKLKLPDLQRHLAEKGGDCPLSEVPCPYVVHGCSFVSLRNNLPAHMAQYQVYHVQIQCESFLEMKTQMDKSAAAMQHLMERVGSLESRTNAIERLQDAIEQRVELLDERRERHLERYEGKIEALEEQATRANSTMTQLTRRVDELQLTANAAGINYSTVSSGYGTGLQPAASSHLQGMGPPVAGGASVSRVDALQTRVVEVEHGIDRALSSCLDQELRIQLLERATYNGVLIWKIDEFERRRKEAIDGVTMSLYSTPFYTSRHGYKMCCRIYLNGDGLGKGTHLSFFFVIMRGPFDGLLEWPFKQKVALSLVNQQGTCRRPVTDSFRPDAQSSSFQRPVRREMNIASGCPMFIKINHLLSGGFVKDDCIYVKAVVDTTDLPVHPRA